MDAQGNPILKKVTLELLKQSPNPIIHQCNTLAEVHNQIAHELFNISFAVCWSALNDKQKEFIIK